MALSRRARVRAALAEPDAGKAILSILLALTTLVTSVVVALQSPWAMASVETGLDPGSWPPETSAPSTP